MKTLKLVCVAGLVALSVVLSGCNTTKGVGQDVEKAGEKIQDAADSNR